MKNKSDVYVFISYSSANRTEAHELYDILTNRSHGLICWLDVMDIKVDETTFPQQIVHGIQNASCLVLVDTQEAQNSGYVQRELQVAGEYDLPILHYRAKKQPFPFMKKWQIFWLAQKIKFKLTQPFWVSLLALVSLLIAMATIIFFFGSQVSPVIAGAYEGMLPAAVRDSPLQVQKTIPAPIDPKIAAPFHFSPDTTLFLDEFQGSGDFDHNLYHYDIQPADTGVEISQHDSAINFYYPKECIAAENMWTCETEIRSKELPLKSIQYFGLRARSLENTALFNLSVSISYPNLNRSRTGFGWNFSDHTTPFFRANSNLPEEEFYAYVTMNNNWHAYEIILDPYQHLLYYYMDGQLIGTHPMKYYAEWVNGHFDLIIYALSNTNKDVNVQSTDTKLGIDQVIVGGFK